MNENIFENPEDFGRADPQFLDVKELNDLLAAHRISLRTRIAAYRSYKAFTASRRQGHESGRRIYNLHETIAQRRHIADLWRAYRMLSAECHAMTQIYLANLHGFPSSGSAHPKLLSPTEKARTAA